MMRAAAEGTTETSALRFWMVSLTVTFRPFQSLVSFAISSPTFLGDCWEKGQKRKKNDDEIVRRKQNEMSLVNKRRRKMHKLPETQSKETETQK